MDDSTLIWIARILLFTFVAGLLTFVFSYLLRSNWRKTVAGRYVAYFMSTMALLFVYLSLGPVMVQFHARYYVNVVIGLMLNYGAWRMTYILFKIQKGEEKDRNESG